MSSWDPAQYRVGDLIDPRSRCKHPVLISRLMKLSILARFLFWNVGIGFADSHLGYATLETAVWLMLGEMLVTVFFFAWQARWEDQEHWITLWQVMYTVNVVTVRSVLFNNVWMLSIAFFGLYSTYLVGLFAEFTKWEKPRVPPFPFKNKDTDKPRHGWLGKEISRAIVSKIPRMLITAFLYLAGCTISFFMLYAFFLSEVDNLRNLPVYQESDKSDGSALRPLMIVGVVASILSMIPAFLCEFAMIPGLVGDWWNNKRASRSYRTGVWDVCELDEDKDGPGAHLQTQMEQATRLLDMTLVLPCYLPNEEDIMPFVFKHYIEQFEKLQLFEKQVFPNGSPCKKEILLVWNSPKDAKDHPEFGPFVAKWTKDFEEKGVCLRVEENKGSTSKCDNLNVACELIRTETCILNDADTMLDWSCIVRGSIHLSNGYDIAQAMNSHCFYDCRGTPGDDQERQCHPYGILITIGDATKPQNMSTQTPFKHAPFNGRGGFWRTSALQKVGFDSRTIGEDHDAGYRGFAYFGFKGLLDMNMLCQEQEPPNCESLTSQRIRWETAALEMRRTFSWILRSTHYGNFETFVLLWGQLQQNCNLPLQALPFQVSTALPLIILKGWLSIYVWGPENANTSLDQLCKKDNCAWEFQTTNPMTGVSWNVALPLPLAIFFFVGVIFISINAFDFMCRVLTTRYRPRVMFFVYYAFLKPTFVAPYFIWVQYWALYDYCWGGGKFIATARSPLSPKSQGDLAQPLLKQ